MNVRVEIAPGCPGTPPRWTSSAKSGVGTACNNNSHVWFTISHGILNEVYYPRLDQACTRDMGLIVTDGATFFSEEKRHTRSQLAYISSGAPAYRLANTCTQGRYRMEKEVLADPRRNSVLQHVRFSPLTTSPSGYHLYVLLAPHLGNRGYGNTGWTGDYKGVPMLFAERNDIALAVACSVPWKNASAGFVGISDGWQDLSQHRLITRSFARAENGNIALTGEIDWQVASGEFVLALGFGHNASEAGHCALASLQDGFNAAKKLYVSEWRAWHGRLSPLLKAGPGQKLLKGTSTMVLRSHESKLFRGGIIASLSVPWGFSKGDDDLGGYHLAWPRDLVETAGGLLAIGASAEVDRVLSYLQATQELDGHWPQNMWLDGSPYWNGIQMDETAFPVLLVDLAHRAGALPSDGLARFWPMVRKAAAYLVRNGPVTPQDRWEEDPGYSPFTLAVEVAALLAAARLAKLSDETEVASYLRDTSDFWNAHIEQWTYVSGTSLAAQVGVNGYYVRISPPDTAEAGSPAQGFVPIKNRPPGESAAPAGHIVSPDALALVRFGLRAPDDPRIVETIKVVDAILKVNTLHGPAWHRYEGDGYGEHADGSPFDGNGIGRAWPLLTGERAHYELAAGNRDAAESLLRTLESFANEGGMIPEQVWDAPDIPERELFFGRPSGSAMPLVWAHAEYLKLVRSLHDGRVFDMPDETRQRYQVEKVGYSYEIWRFNHKLRTLPAGKTLRVQVPARARIHWSTDLWQSTHDADTQGTGLGVYYADLPTDKLPPQSQIIFTFFWPEANRWEEQNFEIVVA